MEHKNMNTAYENMLESFEKHLDAVEVMKDNIQKFIMESDEKLHETFVCKVWYSSGMHIKCENVLVEDVWLRDDEMRVIIIGQGVLQESVAYKEVNRSIVVGLSQFVSGTIEPDMDVNEFDGLFKECMIGEVKNAVGQTIRKFNNVAYLKEGCAPSLVRVTKLISNELVEITHEDGRQETVSPVNLFGGVVF